MRRKNLRLGPCGRLKVPARVWCDFGGARNELSVSHEFANPASVDLTNKLDFQWLFTLVTGFGTGNGE
jgi:hypothetical protein